MKSPSLPFDFPVLAALAFALIGCTSVPDAPAHLQQRALSFQPPAGAAFVYVFRPLALERMTVATELSLDRRTFGTLSTKTFLCAAVKPGSHELKTLAFFGDTAQRFEAQPGQLYFFRVDPTPDGWALEPVSPAEGRERVAKYRLSGDNAFEAGARVTE
jgi:hypothetical protein